MKTMQLAILILVAVGAVAQQPTTVHVRSAHAETKDEMNDGRYRGILGNEGLYTMYRIEAGNFVYTIESADTREPEVGKDYQVVELTKEKLSF